MDIIELIFEDYKLLREESLQSMRNRNAILTFGLTVLGVVFHAGVSSLTIGSTTGEWLSFFIFYLAMPVLSLLILTLWLGEAARMTRVGLYLKEREKLINQLIKITANSKHWTLSENFDFNIIYWENFIRERVKGERTRQLLFPYIAVVILFIGIALASIVISIIFPLQIIGCSKEVSIVILLFGILAVGGVTWLLGKIALSLK